MGLLLFLPPFPGSQASGYEPGEPSMPGTPRIGHANKPLGGPLLGVHITNGSTFLHFHFSTFFSTVLQDINVVTDRWEGLS